MLVPTMVMAVLAVALYFVALRRGSGEHVAGLRNAFTMTWQVLPILVFAFIVAGLLQVMAPQEVVAKWVGEGSGSRGILIGTIAGGLCPGGPYVSLPIVAGVMQAGAGIGTLVAFLTAWSLWAVARLPMEVGVMGWRFTLIRLSVTFFFPPIAGFLAQIFFGLKK